MIESPNDLKFRLTKASENLFVIRDDLLPWGIGTKWRKFFGIYESLRDTNHFDSTRRQVVLWGNLHSNYLAAFTYLFHQKKFSTVVFAYTKDPNRITYNQTLIKYNAKKLFLFFSRSEAETAAWEWKKTNPEAIFLPEFGVHRGVSNGLGSLWKALEESIQKHLGGKVKQNQTPEILLEIGSGQTYLSCFDYFYPKGIPVVGISLGESRSSWLSKREAVQKDLGLKTRSIPEEWILEPKDPKERRFGLHSNRRLAEIQQFLRETGIYLEPMYGGKILPFLLEHSKTNPTYYLHQGGGYQHLDVLLENRNLISEVFKAEVIY
ncbi:MAG: hypothetical protein O9301_07700 [Leptospira sp.]|nr:hypothetical protein [Leptospira sp.]